jgi:hypothetical protein
MLGGMVMAVSVFSVGCNDYTFNHSNSTSGTKPGVYTVTVTGASGGLSQKTVVTVTVQ